jgi:hypothetical protein
MQRLPRSFPRALSPDVILAKRVRGHQQRNGYLNALLANGVRYSSRTAIAKTGKSVCAAFSRWPQRQAIIVQVVHNETYYDDGQIEVVIGAATMTLCPRSGYERENSGQRRADPAAAMRNHRPGLWLPQANVDSLSGSGPKTNRRPVTLSGRMRTKCGFGVAVQGNSHARLASSSSSSVRGERAVPLTITLQPSSAVLPSASNNT